MSTIINTAVNNNDNNQNDTQNDNVSNSSTTQVLLLNMENEEEEEDVNDTVDEVVGNQNIVDIVENEENLSSTIINLSLPEKIRIKALNLFAKKNDLASTNELITRLSLMYEMSSTKMLHDYLYAIAEKSDIPPFLKSMAATALLSHNPKDMQGYKAVCSLYPSLGDDVATPYKIELLKILMNNDEYKQVSTKYLCDMIQNKALSCDYRYKIICALEHRAGVHTEKKASTDPDLSYYIREACYAFLKNFENNDRYRILASQNFLRLSQKIDKNDTRDVEEILLGFAVDDKNDYNARADAADVILEFGNDDNKKKAREIIMILGKADIKHNNPITTIYDNKQNVHTHEVEQSVLRALEFLQTFDIMKVTVNGKPIEITLDYVERKIGLLIAREKKAGTLSDEQEEKIKVALNRIHMDRALYGKCNCTITHLLLQIWTYISGHQHKQAMKKRLLEELSEMAGTCSSGFAARLVNTISGFGDFNITMSWRDQIVANLMGRFNARIRDMDDLNLQEKIMVEMAVDSGEYQNRKNLLKFFRKNISEIREDMLAEFIPHISAADFDMYFRAAVSMYESGELAA